MTIGYELLKELAVLAQGRNPVFTDQETVDTATDAPSSPTAGVALEDAIVALVLLEHVDQTVSFELWGLPKGRTNWALIDTKTGLQASYLERYVVAGLSRLFVRITETTGDVTPAIGPCELES